MADGVIGNTTGFDPVILGSSPGRPAYMSSHKIPVNDQIPWLSWDFF